MNDENQDTGRGHLVDFLIAALSGGVLFLGLVMTIVTWRGMDGPNLASVTLLLAGAVLFVGHNICLYLEDCSTDVTAGLDEVRKAIARLEQPPQESKDEPAKK